MEFIRLSKVIALCMLVNIMLAFAGHLTTKRRYATSYNVCMRFHMAFSETARQIVKPNCDRKAVLAAT